MIKLIIVLMLVSLNVNAKTFYIGESNSIVISEGKWTGKELTYCRYAGKISDKIFSMSDMYGRGSVNVYYPVNTKYVLCSDSNFNKYKAKVIKVTDMYIKLEK